MAATNTLKLAFVLSATDKMSRVIDQAVKKSTDKLNTFERSATMIGGSMMRTGATIAGAGAAISAATFGMAKSTADYAGQVYDMARATGVGVEEYQKMAYAAKMSGIESEKLSTSLVRFDKLIVDAANGSKTAAQTFKDLGIQLKDSKGNFRAPNEIFDDVADIFHKVEDGTAKTALAYELFGKSGADLIPMLNDGKAGLRSFYDEAIRTGNVLDENVILAADQFSDDLERIKLQGKGAALQLGASLMPTFQELATKLITVISKVTDWIKENPKLVATIGKVVTIVGGLMLIVGTATTVIGGIIFTVGKIVSTFKIAIGIIKGVAAAVKLLGTAFLTSPVGWVLLIIAAVAAGVYLIIKNWDKVKAFFIKLWDGIKTVFKSVWDWIKNLFLNYHPVGLVIKHWDKISDLFVRIWDKVKGAFKAAWDWIKNLFLNYTATGLVIKHWDKIVDFFSGLWSRVKAAFAGGWDAIAAFFSELPSKFFEWGKNIVMGLWNGITAVFDKVVDGIKNLGKKIAGGFKKVLGINSPSRVFMEYGLNITEGLSSGINEGGRQVENTTGGMAMQATRGIQQSITNTSVGGSNMSNSMGGLSLNYAPNIMIQGGMTPETQQDFLRMLRQHGNEIVAIMKRELQNKERLSFG